MEYQELHDRLRKACEGGQSAIRVHTRLVPVGGPEDKVFPPTYAGAKYAMEERVIGGEKVPAVHLDSVQSEANRLEELLLAAFDRGECPMPVLSVTVKPHGRVTALDAPHRVYDAIFRDSLLDGIEFRKTPSGQRAAEATIPNATGVYEICPTALLFGAWDSHGAAGGQGSKFPRVLTAEIVAINAQIGVRTGGRIDPLMITKNAAEILREPDGTWTIATDEAGAVKGKKAAERVRPSEIGHGNVAPTIMEPGGVTLAEARHVAVLSFSALRRLGFPDPATGERSRELDIAGRAVLASTALYALALQQAEGFWLRSRCHLIPAESAGFEFVGQTAGEVEPFALDVDTARKAYLLARQTAREAGLTWREGLIDLVPSPKLQELVTRSSAMAGEAEA